MQFYILLYRPLWTIIMIRFRTDMNEETIHIVGNDFY